VTAAATVVVGTAAVETGVTSEGVARAEAVATVAAARAVV